MSSVTVSLIKRFEITFNSQEGDLRTCNITSHRQHDSLMPFFFANKSLLREYDRILRLHGRKEEVSGYKGQLVHCTGSADTTGWALPENDCTKDCIIVYQVIYRKTAN